jgi:hypothetical protein
MSRRRGMILVESSSGEYDTLAKLHELAATDSESEGEGAVDYGLVESSSPSSGDDGSYHSDNDELAEYWDPYLYQLQLKAPSPRCVPCTAEVSPGEDFAARALIILPITACALSIELWSAFVCRSLLHASSL